MSEYHERLGQTSMLQTWLFGRCSWAPATSASTIETTQGGDIRYTTYENLPLRLKAFTSNCLSSRELGVRVELMTIALIFLTLLQLRRE